MKNERVIYYSDPLHDDFAGNGINTRQVPGDFCYVHESLGWRMLSFIVYYIIAFPLVWLTAKLVLGLKFRNRKVMRKLRGQGFFLYGNHTQILDAYVPSLAAFPKKAYIVANPDAVSIPGLRHIVMMLGTLPVPSELSGFRRFMEAIKTRCSQGACVAVYPEAHIWPWYTGIRPFPDTSFRYPVKENAPAVAMVVTYRKRKGLFRFLKRPGIKVSFSEIMMPDNSLTPRKAQAELRNQAFAFMDTVARSKDQIRYIRYEYIPKTDTGVPRETEGKEYAV